MARANRHFIPGHIWHLTHRCHKREFLLKFVNDRLRRMQWLYEAKKRYGLVIIERWPQEYNTVRPHSSLGYRPPAPEAK